MSLLFSEIKFCFSDGGPLSVPVRLLESGHPDEHDIRELLARDEHYTAIAKKMTAPATAQVQRYRYLTGGRDWLAETEHFALMDAYDELAEAWGSEPFVERDDVEHVGYFEFELERNGVSK